MCPKRKKQTRIKCKFLIIKHSEAPKCLTQAQRGAAPGRCGMPRPDDAKTGRKGAWTYAGNVINTQKLKSAAKHTHTRAYTRTLTQTYPHTRTYSHTPLEHTLSGRRLHWGLGSQLLLCVGMCCVSECASVCVCACVCMHVYLCLLVRDCACVCIHGIATTFFFVFS